MSIKKIAALCGVSPSTVSRVLNNTSPSCASAAVRDKVWQAARQLNYTPNQHARQLKSGGAQKSPRIAVLLARIHSLDDDPFFAELLRKLEEQLFAAGCTLCQCLLADDLPQLQQEVDGLLILGRLEEQLLQQVRRVTPNLVSISRNPLNFEVDEVVCSGKQAASLAMDYLLQQGHKKIAYIGDCSDEDRYVGYCETLIKNNIPLDYQLIRPAESNRAEGAAAMQGLLEQGKMSAVLCANDIIAIGALELLLQQKKPRPAVISIDNIEAAQSCKPLLSTVDIPRGEMAHLAVMLLLDRINNGHREFTRVELPCRLIKRESCRSTASAY